MSSPEPVAQPIRIPRPVEVILLGLFSVVLGALLTFASLALAAITNMDQAYALWPLVAFTGLGYVVCGVGLLQGKRWAWPASLLVYAGSLVGSILQAALHLFTWGIFFEPLILVCLVLPQVRGFFRKPRQSPSTPASPEASISLPLTPAIPGHPTVPSAQLNGRKVTIAYALLMLAAVIMVPAVAAVTVHTVSITSVTLNIVYPGNPQIQWFGFSPKTVGGSMFTWGQGRLSFRFSLSNLGLFQTHTIDSLSLETPGFTLNSPGLPVSLPDFATVTLSVQLQAPDYNYYGPVTLQMQTS